MERLTQVTAYALAGGAIAFVLALISVGAVR